MINQINNPRKMRNHTLIVSLFLLILLSIPACDIIDGIFKTGMGIGAFVVIVIVVIVLLITRMGRRR
jgi:hypothetical protein